MLESALEAGLGCGRRRRATARSDADACRRAPDARSRRQRRHRDQCLAQPAPGQRHQVFRRQGEKLTMQSNWRSRANSMRRCRAAVAPDRQGRARRRRGPALRRSPAPRPRRAWTCAACTSCSTAPMVRPTSSRRNCSGDLGAQVDAIGVEPDGAQHQPRLRGHASGGVARRRAPSTAPIWASPSTATATACRWSTRPARSSTATTCCTSWRSTGTRAGTAWSGRRHADDQLRIRTRHRRTRHRIPARRRRRPPRAAGAARSTAACWAARRPATCCAWTSHHRRRHRQRVAGARGAATPRPDVGAGARRHAARAADHPQSARGRRRGA